MKKPENKETINIMQRLGKYSKKFLKAHNISMCFYLIKITHKIV